MSFLRNEILYHFVGFGSSDNDEENFKILCAVLESAQVGKPGMQQIQIVIDPSREPYKGELLQQSITCYCDIPFVDLSFHAKKYGRFGVGLDRKALSAYGARPVSYVPVVDSWPAGSAGGFFLKDQWSLLQGVHEYLMSEGDGVTKSQRMGEKPQSKEETVDRLKAVFTKDFLAFLKFYNADLSVDHVDYYYAEREWRKFGPFPLSVGLKEVIVAPGYADRIRERFPRWDALTRELN